MPQCRVSFGKGDVVKVIIGVIFKHSDGNINLVLVFVPNIMDV